MARGKGAREGQRAPIRKHRLVVENIHVPPSQPLSKRADCWSDELYNDFDGIPISGSEYWLINLLAKGFGFRGYVVRQWCRRFLYNKHGGAR
jgi:beta-glucosidase